MIMKAEVTIERGADGTFSAYISSDNMPFGLIGDGATVQEAIKDFINSAEEMKAYYQETGKEFPEVEWAFKYDVASFLQYYAFAFTLAGLERITGVSQGQLSHYINGVKKPRPDTIRKIEVRLHEFAEQLGQVNFV